jgi:hypothetical protein
MCHVLSAAGDPLVPLRQEQPRLPMLHIRNDDGSYDSRFPTSLESLRSSYGWDLQSIMWTEPTDRKGPFTATLETDAPFEFVSKPLVIKGNSGS